MVQDCELSGVFIEEMTQQQAWRNFELACWNELQMHADEFVEKWKKGKFADTDDRKATRVSMLYPYAW